MGSFWSCPGPALSAAAAMSDAGKHKAFHFVPPLLVVIYNYMIKKSLSSATASRAPAAALADRSDENSQRLKHAVPTVAGNALQNIVDEA